MSENAFSKIASGLNDAIALAKGEADVSLYRIRVGPKPISTETFKRFVDHCLSPAEPSAKVREIMRSAGKAKPTNTKGA